MAEFRPKKLIKDLRKNMEAIRYGGIRLFEPPQ